MLSALLMVMFITANVGRFAPRLCFVDVMQRARRRRARSKGGRLSCTQVTDGPQRDTFG